MLVLALLSVGFFDTGQRFGTRFPRAGVFFCSLCLLFGWFMCWFMGGSMRWAEFAAADCAYLWSYSPALLVFFAAGVLAALQSVPLLSRRFLSAALCVTVASLLVAVIARPSLRPIELARRSLWKDGICLQSHESSCVPAAAATLLHLNGLKFEERELARFAMTSLDGTVPLGSVSAIDRASRGTNLRAGLRFGKSKPILNHQLPMLAHVRFEESVSNQSLTAALFGRLLRGMRARSQGHAVVIVRQSKDGWVVADPAVGLVEWSTEQLDSRWNGEGVYLARND